MIEPCYGSLSLLSMEPLTCDLISTHASLQCAAWPETTISTLSLFKKSKLSANVSRNCTLGYSFGNVEELAWAIIPGEGSVPRTWVKDAAR